MNRKCNIVKDLIPLYVEDMVSEDTKDFIEEHLEHCTECCSELEQIRKDAEIVPNMDVAPLKKLKEKLLLKRVQTILFTAALVFAIAASVFAMMSSPQFFPYSEDLVQITENQSGVVTITFAHEVTGYSYITSQDEETGTEIYRINAWDTVWDKNFSNRGEQNMVITLTPQADVKVYYVQNNGSEDVLLYGLHTDDNVSTITLPRLVLMPYFLLALLVFVTLLIIRYFLRKQEILKMWLDRILPLPLSYMIAHLCTKGLSFKSYATQRDFCMIILVAILLYCTVLSGASLYKAKKKGD